MTDIQARNSKILQKKNDNTEKLWFWPEEPSYGNGCEGTTFSSYAPRIGKNVNNLSGKDSLIGVNREREAIPRNSHFALAFFCLKNAQMIKKNSFSIVEQA